ncbi:MAG: hypothetical protein PQJ50_09340, partial [Spirochaetales bacterium]|nr:hypothetical protein [Spirochaetales bacterium]
MIDPDTILFIPSLRVGNGTGHLKRCLDWAADFSVVHIFTWQREGEELFDYRSHPLVKGNDRVCWHREPGSSWNLIILDNRETRKLPESLEGIPVLAVDETGPLASSAAYLMNTLPLPSKHEINRQGYSFINRPISSEIPAGIRRVLVSFGGEDPEGLADRVYQALQGSELQELIASRELTVNILTPEITSGKTSGRIGEGGIGKSTGLKVYGYIPELSKRLTDYDLVITQYGLTAFEALSSSRYVLLYNPSTYHDRLSVSAGLPLLANTGGKEDLQGALKTALNKDFRHYKDSQEELRKEYGIPVEDFGTWLLSMNPPSNCCPACGSHYRKALARFEEKSYFSCSECGMKYMINFRTREEIYTKEYFFSEYRSQYGKTYIEDFPHIRAMAEERLSVIDSLVSEKGPLLDIGCAYGPFLLSAFERGYAAEGLEISEDAAGYIRENFPDIPVLCG